MAFYAVSKIIFCPVLRSRSYNVRDLITFSEGIIALVSIMDKLIWGDGILAIRHLRQSPLTRWRRLLTRRLCFDISPVV